MDSVRKKRGAGSFIQHIDKNLGTAVASLEKESSDRF